jgi:hypothetical protein
VQVCLTLELRRNPLRTYDDFARAMQAYGFDVNKDFVRRTFKRHGVSVKKAQFKHILRFTVANMRYYARWMLFVKGAIDWRRLKFADETSCESKGERRVASERCADFVLSGLMIGRGYAEQGRALHVAIQRQQFSSPTLTVTCLTNVTVPSGTFISNPHVGTNTADEWLKFVTDCIGNGVRCIACCADSDSCCSQMLVAGDLLVVDNARIHIARDIAAPLSAALLAAGVRMILLPKYSPETNPCELVFAMVSALVACNGRSLYLHALLIHRSLLLSNVVCDFVVMVMLHDITCCSAG